MPLAHLLLLLAVSAARADTGASDTGASDTGAADTGAVDTGSQGQSASELAGDAGGSCGHGGSAMVLLAGLGGILGAGARRRR